MTTKSRIDMNTRVVQFKKALIIAALIAGCGKLYAQDYNAHIADLYKGINNKLTDKKQGLYYETTDSVKKENLHSWLWPLCALIQGANETEAINPGQHYMLPVENAIDQYYSNKPPVPAYQDYVMKERASSKFYDDNEWVAIAYLDAYNRTHRQKYLDVSKMIWRFIESGIDTVSGGGAYWKEGDKASKNTCSNGPAIIVALELYKITKEKQYLTTALALYTWTNKYLQSPEGTYYDNIAVPSLKVAQGQYTYNTGTMLQSNVLLFQVTKDHKYLAEAQRVAKAGKERFFKNDRLPNEYWFNAVLLRGYIALYKVDKNKDWITFFEEDANNIWNTERDADNLLGKNLAKRLIDQGAMIEIYARLQQIENSH